jgi:hypothetical protein
MTISHFHLCFMQCKHSAFLAIRRFINVNAPTSGIHRRGTYYLSKILGKAMGTFTARLLPEPRYHHKAEWHHPHRKCGDHS